MKLYLRKIIFQFLIIFEIGIFFCSCTDKNIMKFYQACANNDVETCKMILEKNPDIPMQVPLKSGSLEPIIQSWLEKNKSSCYPTNETEIQKVNNSMNSRSVVRIISNCNATDVISYLISEGKFDVKDLNEGLELAVQNNTIETTKIFLKNGANPNIVINDKIFENIPLLNSALWQNYTDISFLLIDFGADINGKNDIYNESPLHIASITGQEEVVKILCQNGADVNSRNYHRETPFMYAARNGYIKIMEILLQNGADINACDENGRTTLIKMITSNPDRNEEWKVEMVIKFLIEHNASQTIRDNTINKYTALEYAIDKKKNPIIEMMTGLDEYEEWTPAKVNLLGPDNIGKKICIRNARITFVLGNELIYLYANDDTALAKFERKDYQLGINLTETILSLYEKYNKNANIGYADFYGYVERYDSEQYANLHITHILENY